MDSGVIEGGLNVTLTIRLLMHGKVRSPILLVYDITFMDVKPPPGMCKRHGLMGGIG